MYQSAVLTIFQVVSQILKSRNLEKKKENDFQYEKLFSKNDDPRHDTIVHL